MNSIRLAHWAACCGAGPAKNGLDKVFAGLCLGGPHETCQTSQASRKMAELAAASEEGDPMESTIAVRLEMVKASLDEICKVWGDRKPTGDAKWQQLHQEQRDLERALAGEPAPGGCEFFITRRRRFCSNSCSEDGARRLCWMHTGGGVAQTKQDSSSVAIDLSGKKKKNLSRRMKRMTNPLAHPNAVEAPNWRTIFADPSLPLMLDIGCSKGRYIHELSRSEAFTRDHGAMNFVGVEIFDSLVLQANALFAAKSVNRNLAYISANINTSARTLQFPRSLKMVSIQFPDPWHDPKKANRRVVNDDLAIFLADALPPGQGEVYICSDVLPLAQEMKSVLLSCGAFELHPLHSSSTEWLPTRPYVQPSERDLVCEKEWRAVYRALLVRRALP